MASDLLEIRRMFDTLFGHGKDLDAHEIVMESSGELSAVLHESA